MAGQQIGVVYDATALSVIRLVIPPDAGTLTDGTYPLADGEAQIVIDAADLLPLTTDTLAIIQGMVNEAAGVTPGG